jgi:hypothetical protein
MSNVRRQNRNWSSPSMDQAKRNRLIAELSTQPEPQIVPINVFFDGNDDLGSIGCNLLEHPGIEIFQATFARLSARSDVDAIYAQIAELDPGEGSWPFTDTVLVFGTISSVELATELSALEPDEVGTAEEFGIPQSSGQRHASPALVAWWN